MTHPLRVYDQELRAAAASRRPVGIRFADGACLPLSIEQFTRPADETDERILDGVDGPVLDVGCGPGRHLHALARRGVFALGVDLSQVAVELARGGGGNAIVASIFDDLPGAGRWRSALLLDGNIGIGGSPVRLLERIGTLLAPGGVVLAELSPPDTATTGPTDSRARLECGNATTAWFQWARVAAPHVDAVAAASGFRVAAAWSENERWFARITRPAGTA